MATITINIPQTTFVSSAQPNNNFSHYPLIYTGIDPGFAECIGLMRIGLPVLPVSAIESAILKLAVISKSGAAPSPIAVNKVTSDFDAATVTYATKPTFTPTGIQHNVATSDLYTLISIDITSLVNEWLIGADNNGIALVNTDGTTLVEFATNNIVYEPYFPTLTLTYTEQPVVETGTNFIHAQLANIIKQIILMYPTDKITVYTNSFNGATVNGTPVSLYKPSSATNGSIFILEDNGQQEAIPLDAIAAIYTGDNTVYNPLISYLPPPEEFTKGFDTDLIFGFHEYLPVSTKVTMYMGTIVETTGAVYRNEYGIIVLSDEKGNTPLFIPINNIRVVLPTAQTMKALSTDSPEAVTVSVKS